MIFFGGLSFSGKHMVEISTFPPLFSVVLLPVWTCGWRPFCFQLEYRTISLALVDDLRSYVMLKL